MPEKINEISQRKNEHLKLCLTDKVSFKDKSNGFENYEFKHYAITEVKRDSISFESDFLGKKVSYPFIISCMTGGTEKSEEINSRLSIAAHKLNIPLGVGSQRIALKSLESKNTYKVIRKNAPNIPILGNIGASELAKKENLNKIQSLVDMIGADAMVVHLNPLQELLQGEGNPEFTGFLKYMEKLIKKISVPVIVKEVGAGISKEAALKLLEIGVRGIDVAGAGGTSWAGVEILRNKGDQKSLFWDWGLPTSYCLRKISKLKKKYNFILIGSGGISNAFDSAKAFALGADFTASARTILMRLNKDDIDGVIKLVTEWFDILSKILFLTGSGSIMELGKGKLIRKDKLC